MKNLEKYGRQCIKDLNSIGIYPNNIEKFEINTRAMKRWGQACIKDDMYYININYLLLQDNCPEKALIQTLYHELLHCVDGCMNHGKEWKKLANIVNDCYNVNISRCSSDEKMLGKCTKEVGIKKEEKMFIVKCCDCGNKTIRYGMRSPKWYAHSEWYNCARCGGKLKKVVDNSI